MWLLREGSLANLATAVDVWVAREYDEWHLQVSHPDGHRRLGSFDSEEEARTALGNVVKASADGIRLMEVNWQIRHRPLP